MNRRQKKKMFKKKYGVNPPKGWGGKEQRAHLLRGTQIAFEELEKTKIEINFSAVDFTERMTMAFRKVGECITKIAKTLTPIMGVIMEEEERKEQFGSDADAAVYVAKVLSERRKRNGR